MNAPSTVQVAITGGPRVTVPWSLNMNSQRALEAACNKVNNDSVFTYAIQYYGPSLGYLVMMVNEIYDSFISSSVSKNEYSVSLNAKAASQHQRFNLMTALSFAAA